MLKPLDVYVQVQQRRLRQSMIFFLLGAAIFFIGGIVAYRRGMQDTAMVYSGMLLWFVSIVYNLYDVARSALTMLQGDQA